MNFSFALGKQLLLLDVFLPCDRRPRMNLAREDPGLDRGVTIDERLRLGRVCGFEHDGRTGIVIERTGELHRAALVQPEEILAVLLRWLLSDVLARSPGGSGSIEDQKRRLHRR